MIRQLAVAAAIAFLPCTSFAATLTWNGSVNADWSNAGNWSPSQVPVTGDDVVYSAGVPFFSNYDLVGVDLKSITINTAAPGSTLGGNLISLQSGGLFHDVSSGVTVNNAILLNGPATLLGDSTFMGVIAGTGPVIFSPCTDLVLNNVNTYSGSTTVNAASGCGIVIMRANLDGSIPFGSAVTVASGAELQFSAAATVGSLAGDGSVALDPGVQLTVGSDDTNTLYTGVISGAGSLTKTGTGTFVLAGPAPNTYTGATTVNSGELVTFTNGAIPTTSALVVHAGGEVTFNADSTIGSLAGAGQVFLASGVTLTVGGDNTNTTFSGNLTNLSGSVNLSKVGTGTLVLAGTNTHGGLGFTGVNAGRVDVVGTLQGNVFVDGTLGGTGTIIGNLVIQAGGTLDPGVSPGILSVGVLLSLSAGGTLSVEINGTAPGTQHDLVQAAGVFQLGNATLNVILGYVPAPGDSFVIISNNGVDPVGGTFNGLPQDAVFTAGANAFRISYVGGDGNDVTLTAVAVPGAPTIGAATPGDGQATIAFTAPASNGGSPITGYTMTCNPGAITTPGAPPSVVVPGLANGTTYTCSVTATNAVGTSAPSGTVTVTPRTVPDAPTIGAATPGNGQASIAFTPGFNGGSAVTSFTVTCNPGAITGAGAVSPVVVSSLANGTAYLCSVTATNAAGTSAPSGTVSVTPATVPGAPTIGAATPGDAQATIAFTPGITGGSPISAYTVTCNPGGITASGAGSPITVTGLANGTAYTCSVTATNSAGTSLPSGTVSVTPFTVPGAPTIGAATPGNGQASIAFTPPASNGGSVITGYTLTCNPGALTAAGAASPITLSGLTNGTVYTCSVTATNAAGTGPASGTVSVTPTQNVFSGPSATNTGIITASFTGGGAACTFNAPAFIGPPPGSPPVPPTAVPGVTFPHGLFDFRTTGCTQGATVTFTVTYPVALPPGTQYWKYGPTPGNATPHWYILPATIVGSAATFTITDGGLGDDDVLVNGTIVDQGGPGVPGAGTPIQVPTLSEWALALLTLLLAMSGMRSMRRRGRG